MKNCKLKCTDVKGMNRFTLNKIYNVNNEGYLLDDDGAKYYIIGYATIEEINLHCWAQWELVDDSSIKQQLLKWAEEAEKEGTYILIKDNSDCDAIGRLKNNKFIFRSGVISIDKYDEGLLYPDDEDFKIIEIYKSQSDILNIDNKELLWERDQENISSDCKDQEDIDIQDEDEWEGLYELNNQESNNKAAVKTPKQILLDTAKDNIVVVRVECDGYNEVGVVVNNTILFQDSSNKLNDFDNDLNTISTIHNAPEYFISKFYKVNSNFNNYFGFDGLIEDEDFLDLVWEKEAKINLSRQEIADKFGIYISKLNIVD